jgi:hypothetical protein
MPRPLTEQQVSGVKTTTKEDPTPTIEIHHLLSRKAGVHPQQQDIWSCSRCATCFPGGIGVSIVPDWLSHCPSLRWHCYLFAVHQPVQHSPPPPPPHRWRRDGKWWACLWSPRRACELICIWVSWLNKLFCAFALLQTSGYNKISSIPHYWFIIRITWTKLIQSNQVCGWAIELTAQFLLFFLQFHFQAVFKLLEEQDLFQLAFSVAVR